MINMSIEAEKTIHLAAGFNNPVSTESASEGQAANMKMFGGQDQNLNYEVLTFYEGETIFKENEPPRGLYLLKAGCVKLFVNRGHSRGRVSSSEYLTRLVSPGEVFGYKSLVQGGNSQSYAKAVKKATVCLFPKDIVNLQLNEMNPMMKAILNQAVADLKSFEKTNQFHYLASVQERIAYQLLNLADRFGVATERGTSLNLKLTRNEFAQLASTINESLSRHLTEFKSEGLIDLDGKEIIILDREKLIEKSGNF